jgi:nucleoside-diphosphate-sugar epimerase
VPRYFFSSSVCVYRDMQPGEPEMTEAEAVPAHPDNEYGWEKLYSERIAEAYERRYGMQVRIARFQNCYGPEGTWTGGREKAPAAMCRKVIQAKISGRMEIEIWGTGERTRSYMYIDDCLDGIGRIMHSDIREPINLGSSELVSVNQLVDMVEEIAGVKLKRIYDPSAPQGVAGRNSDNTLIRKYLEWEPSTPLREGMARTYAWIYDEYRKRERGEATTV